MQFPNRGQDPNTNKLLKNTKTVHRIVNILFSLSVYLLNPMQIYRSNCCHCALFQKWLFLDRNPIPLISLSSLNGGGKGLDNNSAVLYKNYVPVCKRLGCPIPCKRLGFHSACKGLGCPSQCKRLGFHSACIGLGCPSQCKR